MDIKDYPIANPQNGDRPCGLFIMDFDGTLLRSDRTVATEDREALGRLGELGIIRAIATGRSLFSFNTVPISNLPLDFVIFSTGAGVMEYSGHKIIRRVHLDPREVERAGAVLRAHRLDFMIHRTIPDNHRFAYYRSSRENADFDRRLEIYRPHADMLAEYPHGFGPATQLLAVVPARNGTAVLGAIRNELADFNVIQTTSPLDGRSTWIEIFPSTVSKSQTAAWLAETLQIDKCRTASIGNDYNDLDLLEWTESSYVVANAPADLKNRFETLASNDNGGVAQAARRWMAENKEGERLRR